MNQYAEPIAARQAKGKGAPVDYEAWNCHLASRVRSILAIAPPRPNRKAPVHPDDRRYTDRKDIARMFGKLKRPRRIVTRRDKTALSFESCLTLAPARLWLKSFVITAQWTAWQSRGEGQPKTFHAHSIRIGWNITRHRKGGAAGED